MRPSFRKVLIAAVVLATATASAALSNPADPARVTAIRTPATRESRVEIHESPPLALPDLSEFLTMIRRQHDDETLAGIADFAAFLDSLRVVVQVPVVVPQDLSTGSAPVPAGGGGSHPSDEHWYAIGRCEQPGNGLGGVAWDTHSGTYEGGLGFALTTWAQYRHPDMPLSAGDATPAQQIQVANDLWALDQGGPWGCKSDVP